MNASPEMVERAWSAMVGSDVAAICHNASIVRGDLKTAIDAAMVGYVVYPSGPADKVDEIVRPYRAYISATPELMSLLYDIDMLPEQTISIPGAIRLAAFCEVWKRMEASQVASQQRGAP